MSIAPNYETLFDVETAIEKAFKIRLKQEGISAFTQAEYVDLVIPRVDIQCRLGAAQGHRGRARTGEFVEDAWSAVIALQVVTKRDELEPALHGRMRGKIRWISRYFADKFGEDVLPYHCITSIRESGSTPSVSADDDADVSSIQFACVIGIRTNAWP